MNTRNYILIVVFGIWSYGLVAQTFESVVGNAVKKYQQTENYKMEMQYIMYSDSISKATKDRQQSVVIKSGNNYYFKMDTSEMIFTNDFNLKISHSEKLMLYINSSNSSKKLPAQEQHMFIAFLDKFNKKSIKDKGAYWECVLRNPKSILPYNKMILHVSKKDNSVLKQMYYFNYSVEQKFDSSAENTKNERLEITQISFKPNPVINPQLFNLSTYIHKKASSIEPSNQFKSFKIIMQ